MKAAKSTKPGSMQPAKGRRSKSLGRTQEGQHPQQRIKASNVCCAISRITPFKSTDKNDDCVRRADVQVRVLPGSGSERQRGVHPSSVEALVDRDGKIRI
jgi:hypothetical protein